MNDILLYGLLAIVGTYFYYLRFLKVKGLNELDASSFEQVLTEEKNYTLIDVREPFEVEQGLIPGAVNIPLGQLENRINEVSRDYPVFLYCQSGMRSQRAAKILIAKGYPPPINNLKGGMMAWRGPVKK